MTVVGARHPGERDDVRIVTRAMQAYMHDAALLWARSFDTDITGSLVLRTVANDNLSHAPLILPGNPPHWLGLDDVHVERRPITAQALTLSFGMPGSIVVERIDAFCATQLLEPHNGGLLLSADMLADPRLGALIAADHALFNATLRGLRRIGFAFAGGYPLADQLPPIPVPAAVVMRVALDFAVRSGENFVTLYGDIAKGIVVRAIFIVNVGQLLDDPGMAWRYANHDTPPPDAIRCPATLADVAARVDKPVAIVRAQIEALIAQGIVEPVGNGFIVPAEILDSDRSRHHDAVVLTYFDKMVLALRRIGYPLGPVVPTYL